MFYNKTLDDKKSKGKGEEKKNEKEFIDLQFLMLAMHDYIKIYSQSNNF